MHAPKSTLRASDLPDIAADILARIRTRKPRVHCITNTVAQAFTANVLLAVGAVPSMTVAPEEIVAFVTSADALLVNLGTLDRERREAAETAIETAADERRPWVLDPVFVERSQPRTALAKSAAGEKAVGRAPQWCGILRARGCRSDRRCAAALCHRPAVRGRAYRGRPTW